MDEYIVSARKYRPLTFDSVVGQRSLTTTLKNAISTGKLAHAYLFCGPRGVGKTTCARIFAKTINCLTPSENGEACGQCESCRAFDEQRSMSIHELDAASNNSVEDIRELIKQVQIPPQIGRYKVFIIDEVHMLSAAAFNAFLKTLEEPPSYVIFILATTEKHKILPTILSRCQVYDFQRMTIQGTVEHLQYVAQKEGYKADPEALNLIAQKADGGMRDALSIFDQMVSFTDGNLTYDLVCQNLNVLSAEYYFRLVDHFLKNEVEPCLLLLNEVLMKGFDGGNFISGLASHMRNLLVSRDEQTSTLLETSEQMQARYHEQALRCKPRFLYRAIKICNDCDQAYRTSRNKRLQLEICLIQAAQLTEDDTPAAGLGPVKILKPIFDKLAAQRKNEPSAKVAPQAATRETASPATSQPKPQAAQVQQPPVIPSSSFHINSQEPTAPLPKVKLQNFTTRKKVSVPTETPAVQPKQRLVTPLREDEVYSAWFALINQMPREHKAMALRMKNMKPNVTGTSSLQVTVGNERVAEYMNQLLPHIEQYLRQHLKNDDLHLDVEVAAAEEVEQIISKTERLRRMLGRNKALSQLAASLKLEFED